DIGPQALSRGKRRCPHDVAAEPAITGRGPLVAVIAGSGTIQSLQAVPHPSQAGRGGGVATCARALRGWRRRGGDADGAMPARRRRWAFAAHVAMGLIAFVMGASLGASSAIWRAQLRLHEALSWAHHDKVSRLVVRIVDLPQEEGSHYRFVVDLAQPP